MFNFFFRSAVNETPVGEILKADMHSHLLPGIDDGAPDLETSIQLIKSLKEMGYTKLITTPHTMEGLYDNTREIILAGLKEVKEELERQEIDIQLEAASEYFMDPHMAKLIADDEILSFGTGKYVLIEMSFAAPSRNYESIIFDLITRGYKPVLAHPERYTYWHRKPELYEQVVQAGCLLQVNLLSLTGYYGREIKKSGIGFLEKGMVSFLGTDLHHQKHHHSLTAHQRDYLSLIRDYPFKNAGL